MKRALALMLAVVLVMSLGITAFAETSTNGKITISNATFDETYKLYKIFDANYETGEGATGVAYSITDADLITMMFGKAATDTEEAVAPTKFDITTTDADNNEITINVDATHFFNYDPVSHAVTKVTENFNESNMFKYLAQLVKAPGVEFINEIRAESETVVFDGLDSGYYVILRDSQQANAVTITTAKPNATVIDKNQLPSNIEKRIVSIGDENDNVVSIGDTIKWELKFTATNYDGDEKILQYNITDTLTPADWAAIDLSSIKVTVDGEVAAYTLTSAEDYTGGFAITIPWFKDDGTPKYDATSDVVITYSATVTDKAATPNQEALSNEAHMTWDTDTENNTPEGDGDKDVTDSKLYNLGFTKVDGADNSIKLENVKFELYRDAACNVAVNVTGSNGIYKVDPNSTSNEVVTPADGRVVIMGLEAGTYYLKETETLDGYNKLGAPKDVTVGENVVATYSYTVGEGEEATTVDYSLNGNATIENNKGIELPSTGGKGTMMLLTFGTMVAVAFAVLMITQKKMSIYND